METRGKWTCASVLAFAGGVDPVEAITKAARDVVVRAMDQGWTGPPFDPLSLADFLKLDIVPRDDVPDARTVPVDRLKLRIEFNPNRPRARIRYSVAHEVAHTLFPDCSKTIRHRGIHSAAATDEWQLEALCNIAAAEFLMPVGSLIAPTRSELSLDHLLALRGKYEVSSEALFIRVAQVTAEPCAMFCASPSERTPKEPRYRLDYAIGSRSWDQPLAAGSLLPTATLVADCTAIGYTAKGNERWGSHDPMHIECVGIPPYPNSPIPRIVGMLMPTKAPALKAPAITEVSGNALAPRGGGKKLIVHIVNDSTPNWGGGGFAQAIRSRWPRVQEDFKSWVAGDRTALSLGKVRITNIDEQTAIASMICQKGYGPSTRPRIRYTALKECLSTVAALAANEGMSVHMPRIGSGQAGGAWDIIRELITSSLSVAGIPVTVYDLPNKERPQPVQQSLRLTTA